MRTVLSFLILMLMAFLLAGCSPIYKTEYAYVPPKSDIGKMCIANCVQQKNSCQQMCQMKNENCRLKARQDAYYQYEIYKNEQIARGKPIKKNISDFEYTFNCNTSCNCDQTYNDCYDACGGEVLERKICVAFCDKQ